MTISSGLSSALSGLTAASKAVEVISNNIANATTAGYGRRELITTARALGSIGQGVQIVGVRREADLALQNDRRSAEAGRDASGTLAKALKRIETAIGTPDTPTSLQGRVAALDAALIEAASRPDSEARLRAVLDAAGSLAGHVAAAGETVQDLRTTADGAIASSVAGVNDALRRIADLNGQIRSTLGGQRDASALMDQRQQLIDGISGVIPLRAVDRDNGQIALFTATGAPLIDGPPAVLGFAPAAMVTADMSLAGGTLSGLTLNGKPVATGGDNSPIAGGSLAAQFALRDSLAPEVQRRLDAVARDLIARFADPGTDATLAPGAPGLFTDAGQAFDPLAETGLAQRLAVNAAADPAQGGALWRLRDGLGAGSPGLGGETGLLLAMQAALADPRPTASGGFMAADRSFAALASDLASGVAADRVSAEAEQSFAAARASALAQEEAAQGVDTDQELQALLMMEEAYAANARVIQTIGGMIDRLLEM